MKKLIFMLALLVSVASQAQTYPPKPDIVGYINSVIKNNPEVLIRGNVMNRILKEVLNYPVDTIWLVQDTLKYRQNGAIYSRLLPGLEGSTLAIHNTGAGVRLANLNVSGDTLSIKRLRGDSTMNLVYQSDSSILLSANTRHPNIQFQDEGIDLGDSGTVVTVNFTGAGVVAARSGRTVDVTITGGGGGGGTADGNNYPTSVNISAGTLAITRDGLSAISTSITTDDIPQGISHFYFTDSAARKSFSATGPVLYDTTTGVFSFNTGFYTASNGLTKAGSDFQLGGTLSGYTLIGGGANILEMSFSPGGGLYIAGSSTTSPMTIEAFNGNALEITTAGGMGINVQTLSNIGVDAASGSSYGLRGRSNTNYAGVFETGNTTNVVTSVLSLEKASTTPAAGIGVGMDFRLSSLTSTINTSNRLVSTWTNALYINRTSLFEIYTLNNGTEAVKFALRGNGQVRLHSYGAGTITGTSTYLLGVDASGNVIETSAAAGYTANNGLTMTVNNMKLGGMLIENTTITGDVHQLSLSSSVVGTSALSVSNSVSTGISSYSGATNAAAISGITLGGPAYQGTVNPTSTNTAVNIMVLTRQTQGTAANGMGMQIQYQMEDNAGTTFLAGHTKYILTDATAGSTRTQFEVTTVNPALGNSRKLYITSDGYMGLDATPQNDDALTQVLVRDNVSGEIKYRTASSFGGGGGGSVTASNGLTAIGSDVRLGGTLNTYTTIGSGGTTLEISGSTTGAFTGVLKVLNNSAGAVSLSIPAGGGKGMYVEGSFAGNTALEAQAFGLGNAIVAGAGAAPAAYINSNYSTTNTVEDVMQIVRFRSGGVGANGIGGALALGAEDNSGTGRYAAKVIGVLTDVTSTAPLGEYKISVLNGVLGQIDRFRINNSGQVRLHAYGTNTFSGTATYLLGVDASGNVIETSASGGSGVFTEKSTVGGATFYSEVYDVTSGFAVNQALKVGHASDNNMRTITLNATFFVSQSNFIGTGQWVQIGQITNDTYRPTHDIYVDGPDRVDATSYENSGGTSFTGSSVYSGIRYKISSSGVISVWVDTVTSYAILSGGNHLIFPINITYFRIPTS